MTDEQYQTLLKLIESKADGGAFRTFGIYKNVVVGSEFNLISEGQGNTISGGGGRSPNYANVIGGNPDAVGDAHTSNYKVDPNQDTESSLNFIAGGYDNVANGLGNFIIGHHNYTREPANHSVVGGGTYNKIDWGMAQTIAGGQSNQIKSTRKSHQGITNDATISGGKDNLIDDSLQATISGGFSNIIDSSNMGVIGGGYKNKIVSSDPIRNINTIAGGANNTINDGIGNNIAGGYNNETMGTYNSIMGGRNNKAHSNDSVAYGSNAYSYLAGSVARGTYQNFKESGDAQALSVIRAARTDGANAVNALIALNLRQGTVAGFKIKVVAHQVNNTQEAAYFTIEGLVRKDLNGRISFIACNKDRVHSDGASGWDVNPTTGDGVIYLSLLGQKDKDIQWVVDYDSIENVASK